MTVLERSLPMKKDNAKLILEIQGLKKYFTNSGFVNKAVNDVSFNVHEGEIVGLIGESGSGKTTVGRSLLRLYDDFNGFVTLDGKVISGKRISRGQTKFLRKNIQMIFQDPHASLNGQKNIYSTLKEPLIVNGIIKAKIKDIFKDWNDVKSMYFYTFQKKYKTLELENLNAINVLAEKFFTPWIDKFSQWSYDESLSFEDNFNSYFGYLEQKQNMKSQIVNNLYNNTDDLMAFYFQKQADFRSSNLEVDESELKAAKDEYFRILKLSKMSEQKYLSIAKIKEIKSKIQTAKTTEKERIALNTNTFNNFIVEFKKDAQIFRNAKLIAPTIDIYLHNLKNQLLARKLYKVCMDLKSKLKHLEYNQVREIIDRLGIYSKEFFNKYLLPIPYEPNVKKQILAIIASEFNFIFENEVILNQQNANKYSVKIVNLYSEINHTRNLSTDKTFKASADDVALAKAKYEQAIKNNKEMLNEYAIGYNKEIEILNQEISNARKHYETLKQQQTQANKFVQQIHAEFIMRLQKYSHDLKLNNAPKQQQREHAKLIKIYNSKYQTKQNTLNSFKIEVKYLNKDIKAIKVLLGIANSDNNINPVIQKVNKIATSIFARLLISNLLIKTTIYKSLEDVGLLKQFAFRYPHEFSGGQRQRIVIARALITEPKVIVADEPIASLDISIQAQVVNLLKDLCEKKNIGMIFIAHDLSMIEYIADRVQIMHYGKIVESGKTEKVYSKPIHPYTINLFKAIPKISNANEKFENISFELDYFKGQQYPNSPESYQVEDDHFIYGTQTQVEQWSKPFALVPHKIDSKRF
ncbi:oligopeptide ABC transporter [Mycoplasmopsis californica]|nr:oligopeptide ABC transporter [Mycoplasmopsis californica]BBG41513.1 oligopeptide ABC transporter [Mycoplasmopsis californica]BBG42106.1 oligopeptide ABC transporter [Mycoplasmopsis californica]